MRISAFTIVRNAQKYYFPIVQSIQSILPLVDEYIVCVGNSDDGDFTLDLVKQISSNKIKIFERTWNESEFTKSKILREETNFALAQCSGDWCFYLQADEVIHEQDYTTILESCKKYMDNPNIDGLLFKYYHFWGDYEHYLPIHGWYPNEIRLIKNHRNITSFKDAQSFIHKNGSLLKVKEIDAYVYHYGWVRPPWVMQQKKKEHDSMHWGRKNADKMHKHSDYNFNYGNMTKIPLYVGTHPKVMVDWKEKISWKHLLKYDDSQKLNRPKMKHEKWKYRYITLLEKWLRNGKPIFGYRNWIKIK